MNGENTQGTQSHNRGPGLPANCIRGTLVYPFRFSKGDPTLFGPQGINNYKTRMGNWKKLKNAAYNLNSKMAGKSPYTVMVWPF